MSLLSGKSHKSLKSASQVFLTAMSCHTGVRDDLLHQCCNTRRDASNILRLSVVHVFLPFFKTIYNPKRLKSTSRCMHKVLATFVTKYSLTITASVGCSSLAKLSASPTINSYITAKIKSSSQPVISAFKVLIP